MFSAIQNVRGNLYDEYIEDEIYLCTDDTRNKHDRSG